MWLTLFSAWLLELMRLSKLVATWAVLCLALFAGQAFAFTAKDTRALRIYNTNTKEFVSAVFFHDGRYNDKEIARISLLFRDFRQNKAVWIDRRLLNALWVINQMTTKGEGIIKLNSGYRTRETNRLLQKKGLRAADNSMHIQGKAIDFSITKVSTARLLQAAKALNVGGVGEYHSGGFIHLDTGKVRHWSY